MGEVRRSKEYSPPGLIGVSRWLVASVLILGPLLWCVGLLLRTRAVASASFSAEEVARFATEEFAARQQLAAYAANPGLTISAYGLFLAGAILLIPVTAILTYLAVRRSPVLATVGGLLVILGFTARVYFAGVEQVAFQLVDVQGVDPTATLVLDAYVNVSYGPLRIPVTAAFGQYLGMPLLAAALYRAEIFGGARVLVLLWSAMMWGGVLKAAGWWDVVSSAALFVVLAALAVEIGRHGDPRLRRGGMLSW